MKTDDIVLIPFPFWELTEVKLRPAIIIATTSDHYKDLILSAVSSQVPASPSRREIIVQPNLITGLRVKSVIKADRIFTLKSEKVITRIGKLSQATLFDFRRIFKSLVD